MLSLPLPVRIFLCTEPANLRRSFDGLALLVRQYLSHDPQLGYLFVIRNKRANRVKLLHWDRDGFAIWYQRLEEGTFPFATTSPDLGQHVEGTTGVEIRAADLAMLLDGVDLASVKRQRRYAQPAGR